MARLELENMEFYAFHGHYPEEQIIGGRYSIDLIIDTNTLAAEKSDDLTDTIDYSKIYGIVKKEMGVPAKLLEHLARRIIDSVRNNIKDADQITVRVSKLNPSVGGKMEKFSVILSG
ncbi:MAG: dihydroneopterin aldolase [Bacteroidales bacterium]|nr:dihydroneopterin aldolase [Bacteroidales bacterium]